MSNEVTPWIDCEDGSCVRLMDGDVLADVYEEEGSWWASYQTGEKINDAPLMATYAAKTAAAAKKICDDALGL